MPICITSPSVMRADAEDNIRKISISPVLTISSKARANRKSPTRTEASFPHIALAVSRPRLFSDWSITSSCSSVALWINSTAAARCKAASGICLSNGFGPLVLFRPVSFRPDRAPIRVSIGRMRLPPAAIRCPASSGISGTSDPIFSRITLFTSAIALSHRRTIPSREGAASAAGGLFGASVFSMKCYLRRIAIGGK